MPAPQESLPRRFGNFMLLRSLGRGGMAEVFLATYEPMAGVQRLVALKLIQTDLAEDPSFVEMFFDEARVLTGLYHPNLDQVLDVGQVDHVPYLALDYLPGRDLSLALRRHEQAVGPLPLDVTVHVVSKVAAGLAHAHGRTDQQGRSLGIIHRDITPENIIVTFEGTVKLVDFGIARGEMRAAMTQPGLVKGKPAYMAPEQLLGRHIDRRVDVFALGVLLYRLGTGRHPFGVKPTDEATFARILNETPPPPHLVRPGLPRSLSLVVLKALEKDPDDRYDTADRLGVDLEQVMRQEGWFPSERRLQELMVRLFPEGAAAARRLSTEPEDAQAAQEASYLSTALREVEANTTPGVRFPIPDPRDSRLMAAAPALEEEEPTEMGTAGTETERSTPSPRAPLLEATNTAPFRSPPSLAPRPPTAERPSKLDRRLSAPIPLDDELLPDETRTVERAPVFEEGRPKRAAAVAEPHPQEASTRLGAPLAPQAHRRDLSPPRGRPEARLAAGQVAEERPAWRNPLFLTVAAVSLFLLALVLSRLLTG